MIHNPIDMIMAPQHSISIICMGINLQPGLPYRQSARPGFVSSEEERHNGVS